MLEVIHRYVELLDKYFGSVCELDIIFNFEKAYYMLGELVLGGEIQVSFQCLKMYALFLKNFLLIYKNHRSLDFTARLQNIVRIFCFNA